MEHATRKKVRQHPDALRQQVLAECAQPGASVARVAQAPGLNANMVHACRQDRGTSPLRDAGAPAPATEFIALPLAPPVAAALPDIRFELRRGATSVSITWQCQAASECGTWLREWLR